MSEEERIKKLEEKINLITEHEHRFEIIREKHNLLCTLFQIIIGIQLVTILVLGIISLIIFPMMILGVVIDFAVSIFMISVLDSIKIHDYADAKEKLEEEGKHCAKCKKIMEKVDESNWYCEKDNLFFDESHDRWYRKK